MLTISNGRETLGSQKPVSTGGFQRFDAQNRYVGTVSRAGEAAAPLRAAMGEGISETPQRLLNARRMQCRAGARRRAA